MIRVVFERSNGELIELGVVGTTKEAWGLVKKFMDDHNFTSYYQRLWPDESNEFINIDVGSHTEFFRFYCEDINWLWEKLNDNTQTEY